MLVSPTISPPKLQKEIFSVYIRHAHWDSYPIFNRSYYIIFIIKNAKNKEYIHYNSCYIAYNCYINACWWKMSVGTITIVPLLHFINLGTYQYLSIIVEGH